MLKVLRKKGVMKKILWFLAVVIILAFGFLGQAYRLSNTKQARYAGKIFGRTVSLEEFQDQVEQVHIQAVEQYGNNLQKILPYLNLESQAWDRLIALHEADQRRIRISNQEVIQAIQENPFFQKDGVFDRHIYENVLYAFRITPRKFEEGTRDTLKISRLYKKITSGVKVSDEEAFKKFRLENEKVQVSYLFFPIDNYKDRVVFDEKAVEAYYQEHKNEFLQPPMINVTSLKINYPENASDDQKDDVLDKTLEVNQMLQESPTPSLSVAAQKFNLPLETSGFFSMEKPLLKEGWSFPLIQKLFQNPVGYITDPIETSEGYEILQVTEKKDAAIPDFQDAQDLVREAWTEHQALQLSKQGAGSYHEKVLAAGESVKKTDFEQFAKDEGLQIDQTPVFNRGQYLPKIGIAKNFQETAFALDESHRVSDIVETPRGYAILYLDSRIPVDRAEYRQKKEEVVRQLRAQKSKGVFNEFLTQLRQKAALEDNISKLLDQQTGKNPEDS